MKTRIIIKKAKFYYQKACEWGRKEGCEALKKAKIKTYPSKQRKKSNLQVAFLLFITSSSVLTPLLLGDLLIYPVQIPLLKCQPNRF